MGEGREGGGWKVSIVTTVLVRVWKREVVTQTERRSPTSRRKKGGKKGGRESKRVERVGEVQSYTRETENTAR